MYNCESKIEILSQSKEVKKWTLWLVRSNNFKYLTSSAFSEQWSQHIYVRWIVPVFFQRDTRVTSSTLFTFTQFRNKIFDLINYLLSTKCSFRQSRCQSLPKVTVTLFCYQVAKTLREYCISSHTVLSANSHYISRCQVHTPTKSTRNAWHMNSSFSQTHRR